MAKINCVFNERNLTYTLSFQSEIHCFEADFKISCPEDFTYKPLKIYDSFLFAVVFKAMESGDDLIIDLPVSKIGLRNINYLIEAWSNLLPNKYKKIFVRASLVIDNYIGQPLEQSIAAFSGGVDASFTLVRHMERDWNVVSYNLKNILYVHGFDIPSSKYNQYEGLIERISPIYQQYDCRLFTIWTNLKEVSKQDWEMSHASQLACCLHMFSEHFNTALLASSEPYLDMFLPWGSTPATDFLLSGAAMNIVHDGAGFTRTEKVERIAKNFNARKYLKVCWENRSHDNCGECEKCYRTKLNFAAVGLNKVECFDSGINARKILFMKINSLGKFKQIKSIISYVKQNGKNNEWSKIIYLSLLKWYLFYKPKVKFKALRQNIKKIVKQYS